MLDEQVPTTVSRPVISYYSKQLTNLPNDIAMEIGMHAIDKISMRHVSFEEEVMQILVAELYNVFIIGCKLQKAGSRDICSKKRV